MKHISVSSPNYPNFFISANKNRIKHYNQDKSIVAFLRNATEFELEFDNKTNFYWLCKISINGKLISDSGLVLEPNSHVYLERHLDTPSKFKFDTYEVDDVAETQHAIAQNGLIQVEFFKEVIPAPAPVTFTYTYSNDINSYPHYRDIYYKNNGTSRSVQYLGDVHSDSNVKCSRRVASVNNLHMETLTNGGLNKGTIACASAGVTQDSFRAEMNLDRIECSASPETIETGRIEEGNRSNQYFRSVYKQWEYAPSLIRIIQILPTSRKESTARELNTVRQYCPECAVKIGPRDKYCYKCGEKL